MWMIAAETPADLAPSWIEAIATLVGVVVALVAIVFTVVQLRLTSRQMRETAIQEAQNSEARTRPYVGIDIVPGIAGAGSMDIIIENHGRTTARSIRVNLVGDSFQPQSQGDVIGEALGRLFAASFDLAPGARRRMFWQIPADKDSSPRGHMGTPIAGSIAFDYDWDPGDGRPVRNYEDSIQYDLTEYLKLIPLPSTGSTVQGASAETHSKNLLHVLRAIAANVAEIRR
jgi:hypothetical protein